MKSFTPCLASFMLTAIVTPLVIRCATACRCLDVPGERRLHTKTTPRWGGAAFFAGVLPFLIIENGNGALTAYLVASVLLVAMGMLDDLSSLDWKVKFGVMGVAATIVIFGGHITVNHIGSFGPMGIIDLGLLTIPFTYLSIIGMTNAINLLDGLNGLAGGVSLLGFLFMGIAALFEGNVTVAVVCFAFVGALCAFLLYNFPNARIFMGDTGSLFLGFSLATMAILLTQGTKSSVDSMFPVLVLLIPIFDTVRVLLVRLLAGKNPFQADNLHLHYLMKQMNISSTGVTILFWLTTAVFGCIALYLTSRTSVSYLFVVLYSISLLGLFASALTQKSKLLEGNRRTAPLPISTEAALAGPPRYYNPSQDFSRKGGMTLTWLAVLGVMLLAAQVFADEPAVLGTQQDKVNYAIGVNMIGNFKKQGIEIDLDLVTMGMRDALSGGKLLMTNEELRKFTGIYISTARQKQAKARSMAAEENRKAGEAFLIENGKKEGVITLPSGLQYKIIKAGNGRRPTEGDTVECSYRGTLIDGTEFDRSEPDKPAVFRVSGVIPGWSEALKLMPEGSIWQLYIPSGLAYGERGMGRDIGPDETLIFELQLLAVKQQ